MSDFDNAEIREACVHYALERCGAGSGRGAGRVWESAGLMKVARELGMTGEDGEPGWEVLQEWMRSPRYQPTVDGDVHGGMKSKSAAWMPGGSGAGIGERLRRDGDRDEEESVAVRRERGPEKEKVEVDDPFFTLLCGGAGGGGDLSELTREEREALAVALESGLPLTRAQRVAVAVALRGADLATRREIGAGILRLISGGDIREVTGSGWEVACTSVTLRSDWAVVVRPAPRRLEGVSQRKLAESMMQVVDVQGSVCAVFFYARPVGRAIPASWGGPGVRIQKLRMLRPVKVFRSDHIARQCALLQSLVTSSGTTIQQWAALFGCSKQNASHLVEKVARGVGGKAGFAGVRWKRNVRQSRKAPSTRQRAGIPAGGR